MKGGELKQTLREGGSVFGMMLTMARNPRWGSILAGGGIDYVVIDTEHSQRSRAEISDSIVWLKAAGITGDKQLLVTLSVTEDEMTGVGGENFTGFYSSMKYFQTLDNENNKKFVAAFKAKYGPNAVIGDVTQAGYLGPWLWKAAVEKAKSFDVDKVVAASPGLELKTAPEGYVKVDANHHLWSKSRIAVGQPDGTFKVVSESPELIKPDPFPKGYQ